MVGLGGCPESLYAMIYEFRIYSGLTEFAKGSLEGSLVSLESFGCRYLATFPNFPFSLWKDGHMSSLDSPDDLGIKLVVGRPSHYGRLTGEVRIHEKAYQVKPRSSLRSASDLLGHEYRLMLANREVSKIVVDGVEKARLLVGPNLDAACLLAFSAVAMKDYIDYRRSL